MPKLAKYQQDAIDALRAEPSPTRAERRAETERWEAAHVEDAEAFENSLERPLDGRLSNLPHDA